MTDRITVEYKGKKYHRYPNSKRRQLRVYYWRHDKWKQSPVALHRQIYIDNFGEIPKGFHIHHKDGDPDNNSPDNLQALPSREHNRITQEEYKNNPEWVEEQRKRFNSREWREKMSYAQKNRRRIVKSCDLCGDKFETSSSNAKWCPLCKSMRYSDKNGLHFNKKKQLERFGKILVEY